MTCFTRTIEFDGLTQGLLLRTTLLRLLHCSIEHRLTVLHMMRHVRSITCYTACIKGTRYEYAAVCVVRYACALCFVQHAPCACVCRWGGVFAHMWASIMTLDIVCAYDMACYEIYTSIRTHNRHTYNLCLMLRNPVLLVSRAHIGWHYSSNATCLMRPRLFYVFVFVSKIDVICYIVRHL